LNNITEIVEILKSETESDPKWKSEFDNIFNSNKSIHLAIFVEPYLTWILEGKKTIESRFSINKCAPYKKISEGDIILFKRSGGPICGISIVSNLWFYNLDPASWKEIKQEFTAGICAQDPSFWEQREKASYATLIKLKNVKATTPISITKKDRRGWVVLLDQNKLLNK
jgi:hypothetical protein